MVKSKEKKKICAVRITESEAAKIKAFGFGSFIVGIRRLLAMIPK